MARRLLLFSSITFLLATASNAQLQRIVLQGTGAPQVFTDINAALAAAQPNDRLYFSGGAFVATDGFTLSMPLHFIGAGMHPDSTNVTGATTITTSGGGDRFIFTTAAGGSSFTGINFDPFELRYGTGDGDDDPVNMVFERCSFHGEMKLGFATLASSSSSLTECVFFDRIFGNGGAASIDRCVFGQLGYSVVGFTPGGLIMRNSVMLNGGIENSVNAIVQNCIFSGANPPLYQMNGTQITNCIIGASEMFVGVGSGNVETNTIYSQTPANTYVSETDNLYQFTDDLHLQPGSPGIGAGNDGTDIGIYGTSSPYKPGNVPFNPHYRAAAIGTSTNANGDLPVNIRVAAQPN